MPTIVDRCQRFDFQRPSLEQIAEVVRRVSPAETIRIDDGAVALISRSAAGSFRDALGTLDQLVAYGGEQVTTDDVLALLGRCRRGADLRHHRRPRRRRRACRARGGRAARAARDAT